MAGSSADELRALRARAYGRDADIHDDADALRRLDELENGDGTEARIDMSAETNSAVESAAAATAPAADHDADDRDTPEQTSAPVQRRKPLSRKAIGILWAASLVLVALVAGVGAAAITEATRIDPFRVGATQVGVLTVDPAVEIPGVFGGDAIVFGEFHDMRLVLQAAAPEAASRCLLIMTSADFAQTNENSYSFLNSGCSAGRFPTVLQFIVDDSLPQALREVFPPGSALQFVLEGDKVIVFSATSATPTPGSAS